MARQSKAEATGRRICGRDGPRDGSCESQDSAAALGGRGAAAGAARRRPNGEEHHGVGRGAGLRSSAAAEAESCRVGRQGVVHKDGGTARAWLPPKAELQGRARLHWINLPLPNRRASQFVQSHFYLDDLPQSTEPLDENPRPHSELGARIEDDFVSADEGYQGRPFPQMRRPSFLGPGPETDSESGPDEAFRRNGFDALRPPLAAPSSSVSGRLGEAALRGGEAIIAAGATGVGQAVERFGFRNAERAAAQVEQRVLPRIIGRPADAEQLIIRAGQRAEEVQRAAAADVERSLQSKPLQKAASWLRCWRRRALRRRPKQRPQRQRAAASWKGPHVRAKPHVVQASGPPRPRVRAVRAATCPATCPGPKIRATSGPRAGLAAAGGAGGEFQDLRTLNGTQQGTPQERFSAQQPRVQQPMVLRMNSSEDDAPMTQQQEQPRPQVRSRPAPQPRMPFGLNQISQTSSGSDSYGPVRRPRPQRAEPSFNELRRAREPEAA